ncbi:unnamed protein product [Phaedon cochleariae]|uniref:Cuticle protein CPCFC domain-containing protein n=1 Tax=Phaedon cochleariae TaxID=80249 RepID=A0A9P0GNP7_PHACE|nr:unnamed protein product [Phaedon cochleariae]
MFVKLAVIACSLALASAAYNGPLAGGQPADLFPAGVDPKACPNFPVCSNPAVAVNQVPVQEYPQQYQPQQYQPQQYQAQPQHYQAQPQQYQAQPQQYQSAINQYNPVLPQQYAAQQSQAQYSPELQNALDRGEYIGDGDYHGEGLAEALAPGHGAPQQRAYNPAPAYNQAAYSQPQAVPQYDARAYNPAQYNQAGAHAIPAQIPAGVDASACPNYPFCH